MDVLEVAVKSPVTRRVAKHGDAVSEAEYWAYYYNDDDIRYEWHNGRLEQKPMSDLAKSLIYRWFLRLLEEYLRQNPIATITVLDLGFRLQLPYNKSIRRPDLGVIRHDNPIQMAAEERTYRGIFDLCIESLSDSSREDVERDTVDKKVEYAGAGVQEYYILDNKGRSGFFQRNARGVYDSIVPIDGVIYSQVLPSFCFRLTDLQRQPSLQQMAEDPLYQAFVLPEYQAQKIQVAEAQTKALTEQAKAERLAAKLRELGILPDDI